MALPHSAGGANSVIMRPSSAGAAGSPDGGAGSGPRDATAAGGAIAGGGASHGVPICQSPVFDRTSQLVLCANGFAHRARPSSCASQSSAGSAGAPADDGLSNAGAGGEFKYGTACSNDSDCVSGSACVCNPAAYGIEGSFIRPGKGICVLATCRTDADCAANSYCAVGNLNFSGEAEPGFGCLRDDDECTTDADCDVADGKICLEDRRRTCSWPPI
jgi:hypothetical protein